MTSSTEKPRPAAALVVTESPRAAAPSLVEVDRTLLPIEKPEQVGATLAGLSAALIGTVKDPDDVSFDIDVTPTGLRYRFRAYKRGER